ncbi:MAG: hypothetical protein QM831_44145 [Kofleriaceae bacterium]
MKIALVYNAGEGEFDSPETVAFIAGHLRPLGRVMTLLEVTRPIDEVARALRRLDPDLVFNIAEGQGSAFREAVIPMLCGELGIPCTGSSPSVLALTLDKLLCKRLVAAAGVRVPRDSGDRVIVKPRCEGSSIGITQDSVRASPMPGMLPGMLVEECVDGWDAAVGYVAGDVLDPVRYVYRPTGPHRIYCAELKRDDRLVPLEDVEPVVGERLRRAAATAFAAVGVHGFARADFRVTRDGEVVFLEINALPSLAPTNNELYARRPARDVIAAIVGATISG